MVGSIGLVDLAAYTNYSEEMMKPLFDKLEFWGTDRIYFKNIPTAYPMVTHTSTYRVMSTGGTPVVEFNPDNLWTGSQEVRSDLKTFSLYMFSKTFTASMYPFNKFTEATFDNQLIGAMKQLTLDMDDTIFNGKPAKKIYGLNNNPDIISSSVVKDWNTATFEEVRDSIQDLKLSIIKRNGNIDLEPNTLYVSYYAWQSLRRKISEYDVKTTIMDAITFEFQELKIIPLKKLQTGNTRRMIMCNNSPEVLFCPFVKAPSVSIIEDYSKSEKKVLLDGHASGVEIVRPTLIEGRHGL